MKHPLHIAILAGLAAMPLAAQTPPPASAATPSSVPAPAAAGDPGQPLATAIFNFQGEDASLDKQGAEIASLLEADLSSSEHAVLVERQETDKVLGEEEMGVSGLVSSDTAAKVGSLTGAQVLVTGRFFAVGSQNMLVAKIISTETGRVYGVTSTASDPGNLPQAVQDLSGKIDGVLASHRDVLVVRQETPDERLQRLRGLLGKAPLPSVTVNITERDYTQPTIDPAAQTEIMKLLEQLGFQVIDADDIHNKADILISGEAFSELGTRHGSLVSSIGRIELKATRPATGDLLWTDRETRVAVDLGSRTAGKDALQNGAQILLERLLPKLTK